MDGRTALAKYTDKEKGRAAALAREAGCSESHLSLFLKGERGISVDLAKRISAATGIPAGQLLGLEVGSRK